MKLILEATLAVRETPVGPKLITPEQIKEHLSDMENLAQETFVVLTFNVKNRLIGKHLVSLGTVNTTLIHPREIFRPAITDGASMVVLAHNHPSGDPSPSSEDIMITRKLVEAGKTVEICVIDHIIVASNGFISLRESGLVTFGSK